MSQYYERPLAFRVASVFSDHMVLQREKNIHIFGEGKADTKVVVTLLFSDGEKITKATETENGKWLAILPPQKAADGCKLIIDAYELGTYACEGEEIRGGEFAGETKSACQTASITYSDVAIGEVWLAGGQSNMEFELQNCAGGLETLKSDGNPNVRFYYTPKESYKNQAFYEAEDKSCWQHFSKENARTWSAVGYYFADRLSKELEGITIGVIGCNWGGTSASAWMSREALLEDKELSSYIEEYEKACEGIPVKEQEEAYDTYFAFHTEWDKKCGQLYVENPNIQWSEVEEILGPCQWPGPMNVKNPFRPSGLYECMLQRVCPYSMRGFIYYQGESDDHKPRMYYKLFTRMIRQWREDFLDEEMPFLMTQLTMHRYQYDEDFKNWPIIREAQMDAYKTIKNTGIAVIIDCGEFNNIHPLDKFTVGKRLALQALAKVYHVIDEKDAFGPVYENCIYHEKEMEIRFKHVDEGFSVRSEDADAKCDVQEESSQLKNTTNNMSQLGFEIAGRDKIFYPADVRIQDAHIFLSSQEVEKPLYARYLWTNYANVYLFGANGLPIAPFRTSKNDELTTKVASAKIQQIMET